MADVLAEAVVELAADADKFGGDYEKALKTLEKDAEKTTKEVDKAFKQLSGNLGKEFEKATREIEREFKRQERAAEAHARRLELIAARNAGQLEREAIRVQREIERERERVVRESIKAEEKYKKEFIAAQEAMSKATQRAQQRDAEVMRQRVASLRSFVSQNFSLSLGIDTKQLTSAFTTVSKLGAALGALGTGALIGQASLAGIAQLAIAVQELVGAIALLPAVGAAAATVIGTLGLGLRGLGDAIKADSPKELAEAFEKLSDNGKKFVTTVRDLKDEFNDLAKSVQQVLLEGFNKEVEKLAKSLLPVLQKGFTGVAKELNASARSLAAFVREQSTLDDIQKLFTNTSKSVQIFRGALRPAAEAFRDLVAVGSDFLPAMATDLGQVTAKFSLLIKEARESGALKEFFANALDSVKDFFAVLGNIGSIFNAITKAANASLGGGLLDALRNATQAVEDFFESARGQTALIQFFESAQEAARLVLPVLGDLARLVLEVVLPALLKLGTVAAPGLQALVDGLRSGLEKAIPGIVSFVDALAGVVETLVDAGVLDALGELVSVLGTSLGSAILSVAPTLGNLVRSVLTKLAEILPKILPGIVKFADALGNLLIAALPIVDVLAEIVSTVGLPTLAKLAETLTPIIGKLAQSLGDVLLPILPDLAAAFDEWITAAGPLVDDVLIALISLLRIILPILPALVRGSAEIIKALSKLTEIFAGIIEPISKFIEKMMAIPGAAKFFKEDLPFILALLGGGLVIALGKLIELLVLLFTKLDEAGVFDVMIAGLVMFGTALTGAAATAQSFSAVIESSFTFINDVVSGGMRAMGEDVSRGFEFIKNIFTTVWETIKSIVAAAWNFLTIIVSAAGRVLLAIITGNFSAIPGIVGDALRRMRDAASDAFGGLIDFIRSIPSRILGALGNLSSLLYNAGQDVVRGMVNGITSIASSIGQAAGNAARSALEAARNAIIAKSPSRAMMVVGENFGEGFIIGIDSMVRAAMKAGSTLASQTLMKTSMVLATPDTSTAFRMNETLNRLTGNGLGPPPASTGSSSTTAAETAPIVVSPQIHVYVGDEELTNFVTDVVDERDRRIKRSLNMGARRTV